MSSLIIISIIAMVAISEIWLDPKKDRPLLEKYPSLAGFLPVLASVHNELLRLRETPSQVMAKLEAVSAEAMKANTAFDGLAREFYNGLTAWIMISKAESKVTLEKIRDLLFPDGLSVVKLPWFHKSGVVEMAVSRMTPETAALLEELSTNDSNLSDLFDAWVAAGQKLGELERQRMLISDAEKADAVTRSDILKAKRKWVHAARTLISLLELDSDISDDVRTRLLQPLQEEEERYALKHAAGADDEDSDEDGASGDGEGDDDSGDSDTPGESEGADGDDAADDSDAPDAPKDSEDPEASAA